MNYTKHRLPEHKSANCWEKIFDNGDVVLQSYNTDVLYFVRETHMLYCTGLYSATTRKHIGWFLRAVWGLEKVTYDMCKCAFFEDKKINTRTGELVSLSEWEKLLMRRNKLGCTLYPNDFRF